MPRPPRRPSAAPNPRSPAPHTERAGLVQPTLQRSRAGSSSRMVLSSPTTRTRVSLPRQDSARQSPAASQRPTFRRGYSPASGGRPPSVRRSEAGDGGGADAVSACSRLPESGKRRVLAALAVSLADRTSQVDVDVEKQPTEAVGFECDQDCFGLVLRTVEPDGPSAGLARYVGWRLCAVDAQPVGSIEDLRHSVRGAAHVTVTLVRGPCVQQDAGTAASERSDGEWLAGAGSTSESPPSEMEGLAPMHGVKPAVLDVFGIDQTELSIDHSRLLGTGSFGVVYQGTYLGTDVAVKVQRHSTAQMGDAELSEWRREVTVMMRLRHPHVLMFLGACFKSHGQLMIVTEMCQGSLREHMSGPDIIPILWREKLTWAEQVAKGMVYLHSKGIHHCDLKTSNVFVAGDSLKIADFGLSQFARHRLTDLESRDTLGLIAPEVQPTRGPRRDPTTGKRTCDGFGGSEADIPGTFAFIAPEVWAEDPFTPAADVYSYGVVLIEIVFRRTPYVEEESRSWQIMTGREKPRMPALVAGRPIPDDLIAITHDCLSFEPHERPTFAEVVARLKTPIGMSSAKAPAPWPRADEDVELSVVSAEPHPRCRCWT
eukprot:TRINITY_DN327_c2_g1_i1.p1 TRINITY_DN327_c2_g1~~TRINITY_DN327_c2_g1_i1.p1  ORF type:complete len:629 (+),score=147.64 TRINITY_DN327_c2_g1_i1:92-1888(+)